MNERQCFNGFKTFPSPAPSPTLTYPCPKPPLNPIEWFSDLSSSKKSLDITLRNHNVKVSEKEWRWRQISRLTIRSLFVLHPNPSSKSINTWWVWIGVVALHGMACHSPILSLHFRVSGWCRLGWWFKNPWHRGRRRSPRRPADRGAVLSYPERWCPGVTRGRPARIWIGVRVRSGRPRSPAPARRAGSAFGWAPASGGSCSCSRSEGSCSSYSSSAEERSVTVKGAGHTEGEVVGGVLRFGGRLLKHGLSKEAEPREVTAHLGLGYWLIKPNYFGLNQLEKSEPKSILEKRTHVTLNAVICPDSPKHT